MVRAQDGGSDYLAAFGRAVRLRRTRLGKFQEQFAFDAELDRTYVSGIERGVRNPTIVTLLRICKALGTTPATILRSAEQKRGSARRGSGG